MICRGDKATKTIRVLSVLLLTLYLFSCVNLKGVRDYADESARLSAAYIELTTRFRDTYQREQPYLFDEADRIARENDKRRKAAYGDLLKIQQRVALYMRTLAKLAGDNTFDFSDEIGSLASGIKAYPDLGISDQHVNAVSNISKVIVRWITTAYQEQAVKNMIREGDADLQILLDGMMRLVRLYRKTNENEKNTVLGFFEIEIPFADTPKDKLLMVLARAHLQSKVSEYDGAEKRYDEAEKGIKSISMGHTRLFENADRLSADEIEDMINAFAKDINTIRKNLMVIGP